MQKGLNKIDPLTEEMKSFYQINISDDEMVKAIYGCKVDSLMQKIRTNFNILD